MLKRIRKIGLVFLGVLLLGIVILFGYFNLPVKTSSNNISLGVTFSSRYAEEIKLNWKEAYLAMLNDLKPPRIRIPIYWDLIEGQENMYDFSDIDWQLQEAQKRGTRVILAIGQKVPRWPECFFPSWLDNDDVKRKEHLLKFIKTTVDKYKDNPVIEYWQIENEPFLPFGECPPLDKSLLDREIALVRSADPARKIIITDSGELSLWVQAAARADIFGTTMYREVYSRKVGYFQYPIGPNFFKFKYWIIQTLARQKNIMIVELQGEPWLSSRTVDFPVAEQLRSFNAEKLRDNVEFAKKTGFSPAYLWGVEWWYWLKVKQNEPVMWETAKRLFNTNENL